jgi:hypothetical protein
MPQREEIRTESFTDLEDARREAQLFSLGITGIIETRIFDAAGTQLDIEVRDNRYE